MKNLSKTILMALILSVITALIMAFFRIGVNPEPEDIPSDSRTEVVETSDFSLEDSCAEPIILGWPLVAYDGNCGDGWGIDRVNIASSAIDFLIYFSFYFALVASYNLLRRRS